MKRFLFFVIIIYSATIVKAQIKYSIEGAPQFSPDISWRVGGNIEMPISKRFSIVSGLHWSDRHRIKKNTTTITSDQEKEIRTKESSFNANFITIPVRLAIRIGTLSNYKNKWRVLLGPYIAYGISGNGNIKTSINGKENNEDVKTFGNDGLYRTRWDYGLSSEIQYIHKDHFNMGIFMENGFRDLYKSDNAFESIMDDLFVVSKINITVGFSVGYIF